jgi:hypothetical protein
VTSQRAGEEDVVTAPRSCTGDDDEILVLRPPPGRRIGFTLAGLFVMSAVPYGVYRMVAHPAADARDRAQSVLPTWAEWPIVVVLALVGLFGLLYSWRAKTWVASDWIGHRGVLGPSRTFRRHEVARIRVRARGAVAAGTLPTVDVYLDRSTEGPRDSLYLSSSFVRVASVLETLRVWARLQPTLVTDEETARHLGVEPAPHSWPRTSSRP